MPTPIATIDIKHFAGTALSGPLPQSPDVSSTWAVHAIVIATESTAPNGFERVGQNARLVIKPETGAVVSPSARLVYATLLRPLRPDEDLDPALGEPRSRVELPQLDAAVAVGTTASLTLKLPGGTPAVAAYSRRAVSIDVSRSLDSTSYDLSIASVDLASASAGSLATSEVREVVVLQRTLADGADRIALVIPMTFPGSSCRTVVIDLTVAAGQATSNAVAALMHDQIKASSAAATALRAPRTQSLEDLTIQRSLDSLGKSNAFPRASLVFLAERSGAMLARSVALVADDRLLQLIAGDVQVRAAQLPARDRRSVAWLLDRSAIESLASVREEDAARVLPPIQGALSLYAGEAGRQLDVLRSLAGQSTSSDDLYNRIVAEHLILLEESSPGLRVRAFEWLTAAGRAPLGYDPLAAASERRAALAKSREPATQATTQTAGQDTDHSSQ